MVCGGEGWSAVGRGGLRWGGVVCGGEGWSAVGWRHGVVRCVAVRCGGIGIVLLGRRTWGHIDGPRITDPTRSFSVSLVGVLLVLMECRNLCPEAAEYLAHCELCALCAGQWSMSCTVRWGELSS